MSEPGERPQTPAELKEQIEIERLGAPLLIYRDDDVQRIAQIKEDRGALWIGRSPSADVSLPGDSEVSKLHAQVEHVGSDCTLVDDGLSRNGSFVNEERVSGRRMLRDGDVIRVGRTRIRFLNPTRYCRRRSGRTPAPPTRRQRPRTASRRRRSGFSSVES